MSLLQKIQRDYNSARLANTSATKVEATLLVTLFAEAQRVGKDNGNRETTDAETLAVVQKFVKNTTETLSYLKEDDPRYLAAKVELEVLTRYLPQSLTEEEINAEIDKLVPAGGDVKMGMVMKHFKENFAGRYDGKALSELLKKHPSVK